jgi:SAM-dependent methyltransferase
MESVLDVGCGKNSPLAKVKKHFYSVGVDLFKESIQKSKKLHIHDEYILCDVTKLDTKIKQKSYDAVIALDLIEHLNKDEGKRLLQSVEKIAKKKVIIMTPNGFYKQEPYEKNPYQIHKSGWSTSDFASLGYTVYGIRGFKQIRGEYATIRWQPWILWGLIASVSQYFLIPFPRFSYQIFAVKNITE